MTKNWNTQKMSTYLMEDSQSLNTLLFVVAVIFLLFTYSFFVLALNAIARSRSSRLRELARRDFFCATHARLILIKSPIYIGSCQIGAFLSALLAGFFINKLVAALRLELISKSVWLHDRAYEYGVVLLLVAFIGFVSLCLVQVAKAIAFSRPTRTLCAIALPVVWFSQLVRPLIFLLRISVDKPLLAAGLKVPREREFAVSAEELSEIIEMSSKAGTIEEDEREMIEHVFIFSDTIVREVMTPRKDIIYVEESTPVTEIIDLLLKERLSRILVTGKDLDEVKGIIIGKDFLPFIGRSKDEIQISTLLRPPYYVPNTKKVDDLLKEFKRERVHFAVVLDEHGGVDGVVTLEDLVEELVGEIFDEHDRPHEDSEVQKTQSGDLVVEGSVIIDDLNDTYQLNIPKGEYDTIAGFVIHKLGRLPRVSEVIEHNGIRLRVLEISQNRVTKIKISKRRKIEDSFSHPKSELQSQDIEVIPENKIRISGSG